jgi:hypothetical protein
MDLDDVFKKHRRLLLLAQVVSGDSLHEKIRNLAWIVDLLASKDESWQADELFMLAQETTPFLPEDEIIQQITKLQLLKRDIETGDYRLEDPIVLHESSLPASIAKEACTLSVAELQSILQRGPTQRIVWTGSYLKAILKDVSDFGFHCIRSWQSLVQAGNDIQGVPFLWNVAPDGSTTPLVDVPGSSATIDIVRLAVEPMNFMRVGPTPEQQSLIQWVFDRICQNIETGAAGLAHFYLPGDDSYPKTAYPINDTQGRVIGLFVHLLAQEHKFLDHIRLQRASDLAKGLVRYLLSQQLLTSNTPYHGFWSFHKYDDESLDGFQVFTIHTELAVKALESYWPIAEDALKEGIATAITETVNALKRTAVRDSQTIGWEKHFSTLSQPTIQREREIFATARGALILATASSMGLCEDGFEYVAGALRFIEGQWSPKFREPKDDVELILYRSPEQQKWTDLTYRISNPISAIMPYMLLKTSRLMGMNLPIFLTEPVNNCMNFALENYGGYGYWLDASMGKAYPTNTAFNMEMLMEYLRASEM